MRSTRSLSRPRESVDGFFDAVIKDLLPVDRPAAARAAALRGKHMSLRMPDALILATADLHEEVETVLCADEDWPKVRGLSCRVELLKPLTRTGAKTPKSR
jgi:predicted nucleic acid-binding protein